MKTEWRPRFLIREAMEKAGMTPAQVAAAMGRPDARIYEYLRGARIPSWGILRELAHAIGCKTIEELVDPSSRFDQDYES